MKKKISLALFTLYFGLLAAQPISQRAVLSLDAWQPDQTESIEKNDPKNFQASLTGLIPFQKSGPFIAWSVVWYAEDWNEETDAFSASFRNASGQEESFKIIPDSHAEPIPGRFISQLQFLENDAPTFQLRYAADREIERVEIHFFDPGDTELSEKQPAPTSPAPVLQARSACDCPLPTYQSRDEWCPDGDCLPVSTPSPTTVTHLIVHHSAGPNVSSNWAAVVRSFWDFHVNVNGWNDIGYNWLVDPNGVLYEGRGNDILGAHFCGKNGGTMGVCVIGDYTDIEPTSQTMETLTRLLSWKACDRNLDPLGSSYHTSSGQNLHHISGHRDGCSTSCPGNLLYPLLPFLRSTVKNYMDNDCELPELTAPTTLVITSVSSNKIGLEWEDNSDFESGYLLERSVGTNDNYSALAMLPANTTEYSDASVASGTTYFYCVKAFDVVSSTPYSNQAFATTDVSAAHSFLNENTVRIFPNPTKGVFTVSIENQGQGRVEAAVYDALGRLCSPVLFFQKINEKGRLEMDISNLPSGLFWIKISQDGASAFFKIVKE